MHQLHFHSNKTRINISKRFSVQRYGRIEIKLYAIHEWYRILSTQLIVDDRHRTASNRMRKYAEEKLVNTLDMHRDTSSHSIPHSFRKFIVFLC